MYGFDSGVTFSSNCNYPAGCNNGSTNVYGCTDTSASNYNPYATIDDGSCFYDTIFFNEEQVITTLNYTLTNTNDPVDVVVLTWEDLDGYGPDLPIITGGSLKANSTYNGSMELLNNNETPAEDITEEILEEDNEHQFFFESSESTITVTYNDLDENNLPVGLETILTTTVIGQDILTITLIHEPNKSGFGVSDGGITNAGGSVDLMVSFPINVTQ